MGNAYTDAGVNVEAGYETVERIKKYAERTERLGVMGALGGFGGAFDLSVVDVKEPVLVSGTDGVGTKLLIAIQQDRHDTIGIDCVAMCVNDILAQGAEPLYFLDYIATGKTVPGKMEQIVTFLEYLNTFSSFQEFKAIKLNSHSLEHFKMLTVVAQKKYEEMVHNEFCAISISGSLKKAITSGLVRP